MVDQTRPVSEAPAAARLDRATIVGAVFLETLRRQTRPTLYWGLGIAFMAFLVLIIIPNAEFFQLYQQLAAAVGGFYEAFLGVDAAYAATPEGYLAAEFFSWVIFIVIIYAVMAGVRITIADEEAGSLDLLLSLPIPRWQLIVEQLLAYLTLLVLMCFLIFLGLWLGEVAADALEVQTFRLFEAALNFMPIAVWVLSLTVCLATIARRRSTAVRAVTVVIVGFYILEFLGRLASSGSWVEQLSRLSFYHYYDPVAVMKSGWQWGNVGLLFIMAAAFVAVAVWRFQRRDIAI